MQYKSEEGLETTEVWRSVFLQDCAAPWRVLSEAHAVENILPSGPAALQ